VNFPHSAKRGEQFFHRLDADNNLPRTASAALLLPDRVIAL